MAAQHDSAEHREHGDFIQAALALLEDAHSLETAAVVAILDQLVHDAETRGLEALAHRMRAARGSIDEDPSALATELTQLRGAIAVVSAVSDLPLGDVVAAPTTASQASPEESSGRMSMFCEEGLEQLEVAESALLAYEKTPSAHHIDEAFRALHTLKGNSGWLGLVELEASAHRLEDVLHSVRTGKAERLTGASELFEQIDQLRDALLRLKRNRVQPAFDPGVERPVGEPDTGTTTSFVRVDVAKLDTVFDEVGELITAVASVIKNPDLVGLDLPNFQVATSQLRRVAQALHDSATEIRMVPLESLFRKAARVVRDVSSDLGKDVALELDGADIEVDRSIVETLTDPLLHLLRNAIDHGVEDAAIRAGAGKPARARICVEANREGTEVVVSVRDDGGGIDLERVLQKARAAGLVAANEHPSDDEVTELLFERGFSTSTTVSKYSGRGVGMDIVKSEVEAVRGSVQVKTSKGEGTTFFLRLPMRLAMIDTMVVRAGAALYALPLLSVTASVRIEGATRTESPHLGPLVQMRGKTMPLVEFSNLYPSHAPCESDDDVVVVVVDCGEQEICLRVDEIIGQRQVVVKPLGPYLGNVRAIVGCSLLGHGDLCLIVDPRQFVSLLGTGGRRSLAS